jgi:hypothetical protein
MAIVDLSSFSFHFIILTLGAVQKNFVQVMRTVELMLGIPVPGYKPFQGSPNMNFTSTMAQAASTVTITEVGNAIMQAIPILFQISLELEIDVILNPITFWAGSATTASATLLTSKYVMSSFVLLLRILGN